MHAMVIGPRDFKGEPFGEFTEGEFRFVLRMVTRAL
jgi:hypothetical protein